MLYSAERKLIFVHVSRTGGTSLAPLIKGHLSDIRHLLNQHSSILEAQNLLGNEFEQFNSFAFVRNPWDRFVSWYAMIGKTLKGANMCKDEIMDPSTLHWKQFDQFLNCWSKLEINIDGVPRKELSQWAQLTGRDGQLLVDEVGRFESFMDDAKSIFSKFGLTFTSQPKINESPHHHYSVYYSNYGRELVESVFQDDIKNFDYSFSYE